jgi:hypothetical protein
MVTSASGSFEIAPKLTYSAYIYANGKIEITPILEIKKSQKNKSTLMFIELTRIRIVSRMLTLNTQKKDLAYRQH